MLQIALQYRVITQFRNNDCFYFISATFFVGFFVELLC